MSALNITAALPTMRSTESSSGKSQEMDGDTGFGDVFRDLSQAKDENSGKSGSREAASTEAGSEPSNALVDALAKLRGRAEAEGEALASDKAAFADSEAKAARLEAKATKSDLNDAADDKLRRTKDRVTNMSDTLFRARRMQDQQSLTALLFGRPAGETGMGAGTDLAEVTKLDSGYVDADLQADPDTDLKTKPDTDLKTVLDVDQRAKPNTDIKATLDTDVKAQPETDVPAKPDTDVKAKPNADVRTKPDTGLGAKLAADQDSDDAEMDDTAPAANTPVMPGITATSLADLALLTTVRSPIPDQTAPEGDESGSAQQSAIPVAEEAGTTPRQMSAQAMQINVLSRETHFAPIRNLGLNGGSAPKDAAATPNAMTDAQAASETAPRDIAALVSRIAARQAPEQTERAVSSPAGAKPEVVVGTADDEDAALITTGAEIGDTRRARTRETGADRREAGRATPQPLANMAADARTTARAETVARTETVSARETVPAAAVQADLPMTGTAAIAPSGVATQNLPTLRQIGDAIAAEANSMSPPQQGVASANSATAQSLAGPVRLLQIQLKPDDLGTVNVRMRLSGNGLEIQLRASNPETARMLERDRDALANLLTASGIAADSITIVGIDSGGSMQLTGEDAGKPFTPQESANAQSEPQDGDFSDQTGRGSQQDDENGARHERAQGRGRSADAGSDFRI